MRGKEFVQACVYNLLITFGATISGSQLWLYIPSESPDSGEIRKLPLE